MIIWSDVLGSAVEVEGFEHAVGPDSEGEQYDDKDKQDPDCVFDDLDYTDHHGTEKSGEQKPAKRSEESQRPPDDKNSCSDISTVISGQLGSVVKLYFRVGGYVDAKA